MPARTGAKASLPLYSAKGIPSEARPIPQQMQRLTGSLASTTEGRRSPTGWQPIATAPFGRKIQLSVVEHGEVHSLVFPCSRTQQGWLHGMTKELIAVHPTHWRRWSEVAQSNINPASHGAMSNEALVVLEPVEALALQVANGIRIIKNDASRC